MRWFPWISREMHLAVIASKNEVIFNLQRHVSSLEDQLKNPAPVNVKVEMPTVQVAQPVPHRRRSQIPQTEKVNDTPVDWALVDVNDNEQMAKLALRELGGVSPSPYILSQTIRRIKFSVSEAKREKLRKMADDLKERVGVSPETSRISAEALADHSSEYVPAHIKQMIDDAEAV